MEESKYYEQLYKKRIEYKNFCVIRFTECWDGLSNHVEFFHFMEQCGWESQLLDIIHIPMCGKNYAESTEAEILFRKIK